MASTQQSFDFYSYFSRLTSYSFLSQNFLGRLPSNETTTSSVSLNDLDDYCLAQIFEYLDFKEIVRCREVCRRLHQSIMHYLDTRKQFTYDCKLNGTNLHYGQYRFNLAAFSGALQHMPNIRSLSFDRCSTMNLTLATCQLNLIEIICTNIYELREFHIGRSLSIDHLSLTKLIYDFPELSHLTVSIFNERHLELIVDGFSHLQYLNLDSSILSGYADILRRLSSNIKTFIAPGDFNNEKMSILDALSEKQLERVEFKVCIHNFDKDSHFFTKIGTSMSQLKWFKCELSCSRMINSISMPQNDENANPIEPELHIDYDRLPPPHINNNNSNLHYEHRHTNLIHGLHNLTNLRVLILKEDDYFGTEDRCSLLDDESLLEIFKCCSKLRMLTVSCSIRRNKPDYHRYDFDTKENCSHINRLLNCQFRKSKHENSVNNSCNGDYSPEVDHVKDGLYKSIDDKTSESDLNESVIGALFNCDSDHYDGRSLDSGISDLQLPHIISDTSLALVDTYLPKLEILQLRGVRLGLRSIEAISNLKHLKLLRLDSIVYESNECSLIVNANQQLITKLTNSNVNIRITNIPMI